MKISVIGCGYLGAVHAVSLAKLGHEVVGIDVDEEKVLRLSRGKAPFFEPGFQELLSESLKSKRLRFSADFREARQSEAHFLTVGTPQRSDSNSADLTYLFSALNSLKPFLSEDSVVIGKSTVPVGTAAQLQAQLQNESTRVALAWNPEFLREGFAIEDTLRPDRLVYGITTDASGDRARQVLDTIYKGVIDRGTPVIIANFETAELVKVAANSFLATKISFINGMAEICEATGADVTKLADALGYDSRIGRQFLNAGVGFGGGCLPKDIRAFSARASELGLSESVSFLSSIDAINLRRRQRVVHLANRLFEGDISGKKICILGATFKPGSDDVRDSPALFVAKQLHDLGAEVSVTDPKGLENARRVQPELLYKASAPEAIRGSDLVVLLTEWSEFTSLNPEKLVAEVSNSERATIIDGRNCLDAEQWRNAGWTYIGLGR